MDFSKIVGDASTPWKKAVDSIPHPCPHYTAGCHPKNFRNYLFNDFTMVKMEYVHYSKKRAAPSQKVNQLSLLIC